MTACLLHVVWCMTQFLPRIVISFITCWTPALPCVCYYSCHRWMALEMTSSICNCCWCMYAWPWIALLLQYCAEPRKSFMRDVVYKTRQNCNGSSQSYQFVHQLPSRNVELPAMIITLLKWVHKHLETGELTFSEAAWNVRNNYPIWFFITHGRPFPVNPIFGNFILHNKKNNKLLQCILSYVNPQLSESSHIWTPN